MRLNLLLTSVGRRSYLVKYFREALGSEGEVHAANSTGRTPAFAWADKSVVTPLIHDRDYIPFLLDYCGRHGIGAILSLFDIDLPVLAAHRKEFEDRGVRLLVSSAEVVAVCNDKWETRRFLEANGFPAPAAWLKKEDALRAVRDGLVSFPLIIKPRWGMGSIALYEADDERELDVLYEKAKRDILKTYLKYESRERIEEGVLIQEKLEGDEYGLDIINDLEGEYRNTVVKLKHAMRSGETDCAMTVESPLLQELGRKLAVRLRHIGNLDADVFVRGGTPYVLDLNARFGGGYPFSHAAGVNLPLAIVKWLKGEPVGPELLTARPGVTAHKDLEITLLGGTADGGNGG